MSRTPAFRKFRPALSELLHRVYRSTVESDVLLDDIFLPAVEAWVSALSSSTLRSLRHTATFVALTSVTQFNKLSREQSKELAVLTRQRDTEKKKSRQDKARVRDLEEQVQVAEEVILAIDKFVEDMVSR